MAPTMFGSSERSTKVSVAASVCFSLQKINVLNANFVEGFHHILSTSIAVAFPTLKGGPMVTYEFPRSRQ